MNIIRNKKIRIRIIIFSIITILIIGTIIFTPKIIKMIEDAKWKKGIYILPTSQYHAFGRDEFSTITQLNFICVKESEETFLSFLKEYRFVLSNDDGDELELVFNESIIFPGHKSINLVIEEELYKHYAINFLLEFETREYREYDKISIYQGETEKESIKIGQIIYDFYDYDKTTSSEVYVPTFVTDGVYKLAYTYSVRNVDNYTIESMIIRLIDDDGLGSTKIYESYSDLSYYIINAVCSPTKCSSYYDPFFTTTNDFLTYTFKPLTKYIVNDVEYFDTYQFPLLYFRVLTNDKYFEVSDTFTNLLPNSI